LETASLNALSIYGFESISILTDFSLLLGLNIWGKSGAEECLIVSTLNLALEFSDLTAILLSHFPSSLNKFTIMEA
jgi:hypothetical protein